jgi:hypothetical protein
LYVKSRVTICDWKRERERERERDIIRDFISAASANIDIGDHLSIYVSLGDVSERDTGDANRVF